MNSLIVFQLVIIREFGSLGSGKYLRKYTFPRFLGHAAFKF